MTPTQSSTQIPEPTEKSLEYFISTKKGTPREKFDDFIQDLDQGRGESYIFDNIESQSYLTDLKPAIVDELLSKYDFISRIFHDAPMDETYDGGQEEFRAIALQDEPAVFWRKDSKRHNIPGVARQSSQTLKRALLPEEVDAPWWKKILSAPPRNVDEPRGTPKDDPPYLAEDSGGKGTTIYILDDGFDTTLQVRSQLNTVTLTNLRRNLPRSIAQ